MEVTGEPHHFKRVADVVPHLHQQHFATVVTFAITLSIPQRTKSRTGHVLQLTHIHDYFVFAALVGSFKRLCKPWSFDAIQTTIDRDQFCLLEFLDGDFHGSSSKLVRPLLASSMTLTFWILLQFPSNAPFTSGVRVRRRASPDWDKRNEKELPITNAPG